MAVTSLARQLPQHVGIPDSAEVDYVQRARDLGPEIEAFGHEIEKGRQLPRALVDRLIDAGLFRLLQPRGIGGAEVTPMIFAQVLEEVASHDGSAAWCVGQGNGCSMTSALFPPQQALKIWGERGIVAWGPPGPGEARPVPGGYLLSGKWMFASGSHHATWLGTHVAALDADGKPMLHADGSPILRTCLIPASEIDLSDIWHVIGLRGTGSDGYTLKDHFIPEEHTVTRLPGIKPKHPSRLHLFSSSFMYAAGFAGLALGLGRGTLDAFITVARDKVPRGAKRTMRENNVIQSQVAQAEAKLRSARAFLLGSLEEIWEEVGRTGAVTDEQNTIIRLASTWAIHQAGAVVDTMYHAAGATAIFVDNPFERRFRDIHAVMQQMQGRQSHFESVGRIFLGLDPEETMFSF